MQIRQGDVLTIQTKVIDKRFTERSTQNEAEGGRTILAYGEATGHHHSFPGAQAKLFRYDDTALTSYVEVVGVPSALTHQEHGPIEHAPGKYQVRQQRQWTLERVRRVVD